MSESRTLLPAAALLIASELMFASMGATVKALSAGLPNEVLVFFRNLFGLAALMPFLLRRGVPGLRTQVFHLHLLRAVAGVSAMYCFFYALGNLAMADTLMLKMTAPIFIPVFAYLWLREEIGWAALLAVAIGFVGVGMLIKPPGEALNPVALVALAGGVLAALAKVTVRSLRGEPAARVVFYFAVIAASISSVPLLWNWQMPTPKEWLMLAMLGALATAGQLLMTRAYAYAPAARVGPFTYVAVVFAAVYGWLFWGERLDAWDIVGGVLITVSGIIALRGGGALGRRRAGPGQG